MKKKMKTSTDLCSEFWKKYEDADCLERDKLLTPIIKNFTTVIKIKEEKLRQQVLKMYLRSYFDDLIEYFNCKDKKTMKKAN